MPWLDHFHAPIYPRYQWESFHSAWATTIMGHLNANLPEPRYLASASVHLGSSVEADVIEREDIGVAIAEANGHSGVVLATYAPPKATASWEAVFPDDIEIRVLDTQNGMIVVAVVELVSPANKDRYEHRRAFVDKCSAYLQKGIGLAIVDVVTSRLANLHAELAERIGASDSSAESMLYATSYWPIQRSRKNRVDVWVMPLTVGGELPTLPLGLKGGECTPLDLEATYAAARAFSGLRM